MIILQFWLVTIKVEFFHLIENLAYGLADELAIDLNFAEREKLSPQAKVRGSKMADWNVWGEP